MTLPEDDYASRRAQLAADIARQRRDLTQAYLNLEKPIRYTEYGMKGFAFFRQNPWIFAAVPAGMSVISTLFGLRKSSRAKPGQQKKSPETANTPIKVWFGRAYQLYQLYRRVRSFIP